MRTLTIRQLDDETFERFRRRANENQRNVEAHARWLIIQDSQAGQLETAGEILDEIWGKPAPQVSEEAIVKFQKQRGKRSNRP